MTLSRVSAVPASRGRAATARSPPVGKGVRQAAVAAVAARARIVRQKVRLTERARPRLLRRAPPPVVALVVDRASVDHNARHIVGKAATVC